MTKTLEHISLSQLNTLVGEAIATHLERSYWIVAEVVELRENYSGHCYLSLAEKENDKLLAQSKAAIWQQTYRMIKPYFEQVTGQVFAAGIKVRIKVAVSFHNVYGLNMTIQDIDPAYTIGELTLRRQQILNQLNADGVAEMNKSLEMATLPQRIAIISSPTAAGYEDFVNQLDNNPNNYKFRATLFSAVMQGEGAEQSIVSAMEQIFETADDYDALVIIRGGGAALDLSCFDNYNIAYYLTQMPIPVIVGIGHERDETVLDLVAHTSVKTPTAVAAFLIHALQQAEAQVDHIMERLQSTVHNIVLREKQHIYSIAGNLPMLSNRIFSKKKEQLSHYIFKAKHQNSDYFRSRKERIHDFQLIMQSTVHDAFLLQNQMLEKALLIADLSDPKHVLKRGYSITLKDGEVLKSDEKTRKGDTITTVMYDSELDSIVK